MTVWRQVRAAEATAAEASAIAGAADDHDRVCRAAASLEAARRKLLSLGHGDVPELAEVAHAPHAVAAAVLAAARRRVDDDRTRSGPHVKVRGRSLARHDQHVLLATMTCMDVADSGANPGGRSRG